MKQFLQENKVFIALYIIFLIAGGIIITTFEKGNEILYFNSLHTPLLNQFFKRTTRLAEGPLFLFIILITIRLSYGKGMILALNLGLVSLVTFFLKTIVFHDSMRPSVLFEGKVPLNFVQGVEVLHFNSFPSGHTSSAFGVFFMLSLLTIDKRWSILLFVLALAVGISRVYLLQHFFRDIYAGSLVGVIVSSIFYLTFVRSRFYENISWREKKLI